MNKAWTYVILTSLFEILWILGFNIATNWWQWAIIAPIIILDFIFLSKACERLPTGTVYAIFAAFGTVGTALMDIFIFGENFNTSKIFFIFLLIFGVVILNFTDNKTEKISKEGDK